MANINENIEIVEVKRGMGIWGNYECIQCGACCYEWHKHLFEIEAKETERCKDFKIRDGLVYCLSHEQKRELICSKYFCGDTNFRSRFSGHGDKILREIAKMLGTMPDLYKIPVLPFMLSMGSLSRLENQTH